MSDGEKEHQKFLEQIQDKIRNLEVVYSAPNGTSISMKADPDKPADLDALLKASKDFWDSDLGQSMKCISKTMIASRVTTLVMNFTKIIFTWRDICKII